MGPSCHNLSDTKKSKFHCHTMQVYICYMPLSLLGEFSPPHYYKFFLIGEKIPYSLPLLIDWYLPSWTYAGETIVFTKHHMVMFIGLHADQVLYFSLYFYWSIIYQNIFLSRLRNNLKINNFIKLSMVPKKKLCHVRIVHYSNVTIQSFVFSHF